MAEKKLTPMRAIRAKCMDCSGGSFHEVRECPCVECPLYSFRSGHRPKKTDSNEEVEEIPTEEDIDE